MGEKITLKGILHTSPEKTHNGRIYPEEVFDKALEDYQRKLRYERRKKIINKLLKNNT